MSPDREPIFATPRLQAYVAQPDDAARLQAVFRDCGEYFLPITGRPEPAPDAAEREIAAAATTPGRGVALLVDPATGADVGAIGGWLAHPEPDIALLGMLLIAPPFRGQGLARAALDGWQRWAAGRGIRRIRTAVSAGQPDTHALLAALGFRNLDERTHVSTGDRSRLMISFFEMGVGGTEAASG